MSSRGLIYLASVIDHVGLIQIVLRVSEKTVQLFGINQILIGHVLEFQHYAVIGGDDCRSCDLLLHDNVTCGGGGGETGMFCVFFSRISKTEKDVICQLWYHMIVCRGLMGGW